MYRLDPWNELLQGLNKPREEGWEIPTHEGFQTEEASSVI